MHPSMAAIISVPVFQLPILLILQLHECLHDDVKDITFTNLGRNGYGHVLNYKDPEIVNIVK